MSYKPNLYIFMLFVYDFKLSNEFYSEKFCALGDVMGNGHGGLLAFNGFSQSNWGI